MKMFPPADFVSISLKTTLKPTCVRTLETTLKHILCHEHCWCHAIAAKDEAMDGKQRLSRLLCVCAMGILQGPHPSWSSCRRAGFCVG